MEKEYVLDGKRAGYALLKLNFKELLQFRKDDETHEMCCVSPLSRTKFIGTIQRQTYKNTG